MPTRANRHLSYANVMSTIAVFAVVGGGAFAIGAVPDRNGSINACYVKKGKRAGDVRLLVKGTKCRRGEAKIAWNQRGLQGLPGTAGAPGAKGDAGAAGATGPAGEPNPNAANSELLDSLDSTAFLRSNAAAGGDLTGTFPAPLIGPDAVGTNEVDGTLVAGDIADTSSLGTNEINESNLFNDNSLAAADIANNAVGAAESGTDDEIADGSVDTEDVTNNSLTTSDIDDATLNVSQVNGTQTAVAHLHMASNTTESVVFSPGPLISLNAGCSVGETTFSVDNFVNDNVASFLDTGAADPTFSSIANGGTGTFGTASASDLLVWHLGNRSQVGNAALRNQVTYIIGNDESGTGCSVYVRAIWQNQN